LQVDEVRPQLTDSAGDLADRAKAPPGDSFDLWLTRFGAPPACDDGDPDPLLAEMPRQERRVVGNPADGGRVLAGDQADVQIGSLSRDG